eukprot:m.270365 g.270365  ORF g.270365 m.270365 type:complete len:54 (-) comp38877_c0_seq1:112-273(-)
MFSAAPHAPIRSHFSASSQNKNVLADPAHAPSTSPARQRKISHENLFAACCLP